MNDITSREYWNKKYDTDEYVYTTVVNRFVKEYCEGLKPGKMIDLAGGEGRNSVYFAELGWQVENIATIGRPSSPLSRARTWSQPPTAPWRALRSHRSNGARAGM